MFLKSILNSLYFFYISYLPNFSKNLNSEFDNLAYFAEIHKLFPILFDILD